MNYTKNPFFAISKMAKKSIFELGKILRLQFHDNLLIIFWFISFHEFFLPGLFYIFWPAAVKLKITIIWTGPRFLRHYLPRTSFVIDIFFWRFPPFFKFFNFDGIHIRFQFPGTILIRQRSPFDQEMFCHNIGHFIRMCRWV